MRAVCAAPVDERTIDGGSESWHSFQLYLRAFLAPDGIGPMLRDAEESYALEQSVPGADLSEVSRVLAVACYLSGRARRAARLFADVVDESELPAIRAYALAFLALIA